MNLLNFLYDFANSDMVYYVLIVLLIAISLAMLYLVYSQNKEISKQLARKNMETKQVEEKKEFMGSPYEELESLDGREKLIEISKKTIPKPIEYTQTLFSNTELQELQDITKEIETDYKDKKTSIDIYEEEQEESAIISYEELLSKTQVMPKMNEEVKSDNYKHEEDFLERLRNLNNSLK